MGAGRVEWKDAQSRGGAGPRSCRVALLTTLAAIGAIGGGAAIVTLGGCAAPPRTTLMRASDLEMSTGEIVQQLAGSEFLRARLAANPQGAASVPASTAATPPIGVSAVTNAGASTGAGPVASVPEIVLKPVPMRNESDNRLSRGDQWAAMSLVLLDPNMLALLRQANIRVQMPLLESQRIARAGLTINEPPSREAPTHLFTATLRSITRGEQGGKDDAGRRDTFLWEYQILNATTREVVWSGSNRFARVARGSFVD